MTRPRFFNILPPVRPAAVVLVAATRKNSKVLSVPVLLILALCAGTAVAAARKCHQALRLSLVNFYQSLFALVPQRDLPVLIGILSRCHPHASPPWVQLCPQILVLAGQLPDVSACRG